MKVKKSVMAPYSVAQMYEIVEDINRYPEFLPWCDRVEILAHTPSASAERDYRRTARIHIRHLGLESQFTTLNHCIPNVGAHASAKILVLPASANLTAQDPFQAVQGVWEFTPVGALGSKISVEMDYTFKNRLIEKILGSVFATIIEGFAQSFVKRAHAIYRPNINR